MMKSKQPSYLQPLLDQRNCQTPCHNSDQANCCDQSNSQPKKISVWDRMIASTALSFASQASLIHDATQLHASILMPSHEQQQQQQRVCKRVRRA